MTTSLPAGPGLAACSACLPGTAKSATLSGLCENCAPGTYTGVSAASSCILCPIGNVSATLWSPESIGGTGIQSSVTGTWYGGSGLSRCPGCPHNSVTLGTGNPTAEVRH